MNLHSDNGVLRLETESVGIGLTCSNMLGHAKHVLLGLVHFCGGGLRFKFVIFLRCDASVTVYTADFRLQLDY